MSKPQDITRRLVLLGITDDTKQNISIFFPTFTAEIDGIIKKFYAHILSFPEGKEIFSGIDIRGSLERRQKEHWIRLFSCRFDAQYTSSAIRVGQAHFEKKIAPYLYLAGYNFFHCELIQLISKTYAKSIGLPSMLSGITRLITLDMDLALSAYTREYWKRAPFDLDVGDR